MTKPTRDNSVINNLTQENDELQEIVIGDAAVFVRIETFNDLH